MRVFHFVIKKKKEKGPETEFLFFLLMIVTVFKSILILIITSLAIHYPQNVFHGFSMLVCIGVQVFYRGFFFFSLLLSRVTRSRARLALASVRLRNTEELRLFCRSRPPQ